MRSQEEEEGSVDREVLRAGAMSFWIVGGLVACCLC
jgi:hypothetical protein